jgi:hypothetical protein
MLVKAVIVFLGVMVIIGMVGRALFSGRVAARKTPVCAKCGRYVIGAKTCDCKG